MPLTLAIAMVVWGALRGRRWLIGAGVIVLLVASNPTVARIAIRYTEGGAVRRSAQQIPSADAVVVLSAGRVQAPGPEHVSEWIDANRYFGGLEVFRAGKAPVMVFTAPLVPWDPDATPEGELLRDLAVSMGVPATQIAVSGRVFNTEDEAREVAILLRARGLAQAKVILVTSAFHMPRAKALFEDAGMAVVDFPVDFAVTDGGRSRVLDLLPTSTALSLTQIAVRECYGRAFYWLRRTL